MYGHDICTLEIYSMKENPLFTKTGDQGKNWQNTSMTTFILGSQKVRSCMRKISNNTKLFTK